MPNAFALPGGVEVVCSLLFCDDIHTSNLDEVKMARYFVPLDALSISMEIGNGPTQIVLLLPRFLDDEL